MSFLQNEEIGGPATRAKLLAIVANAQKKAFMERELAATVDLVHSSKPPTYWREMGHSMVECFEIIQTVQAAIQSAHTHQMWRLLAEG